MLQELQLIQGNTNQRWTKSGGYPGQAGNVVFFKNMLFLYSVVIRRE